MGWINHAKARPISLVHGPRDLMSPPPVILVPMTPAEPELSAKEAKVLLQEADRLHTAARHLIADHDRARTEVQQALAPLRSELARAELTRIPVTRIKDVTEGRLRLGPLEEAGFQTVLEVLDSTPYALQ